MQQRVSVLEKIGFSLINLGNIPIMTLLNTYLLIFYTDVVGIAPSSVATLFLISRIMDGFSDPIIGFLIDRSPKTKFGKYRPILIIGVFICCLNYLLVWFGPLFFKHTKLIVIWITYLLMGITFDLMDIPLNSLIPVITNNDKERNILSSIKGISYTIGASLLNILAPLLLAAFNDKEESFRLLIIITVIFVVFSSFLGTFLVKERSIPRSTTREDEKYSIKDLARILTIKPVVILFIAMLLVTAAINIFNGSILYYSIYILGSERSFGIASIFGLFGAVIAGIITPLFSSKFSKNYIYIFGMITIALVASRIMCKWRIHSSI